jgi:hypothetical protein
VTPVQVVRVWARLRAGVAVRAAVAGALMGTALD